MKIKLLIILLFIFSNCKANNSKIEIIVTLLNEEKMCIVLYGGNKECIELKGKKVFMHPYHDTLHDFYFLETDHEEFKEIIANDLIINQVKLLCGKKLDSNLFNNIKLELTNKVDNAEIEVLVSPYFVLDEYGYYIVRIKEGTHKKWIVKIKEKEGNIVAKEIIQLLN